MAGAPAPPGDRAIVLAASVRSLRRWWIEASKAVGIPLRLLASDRDTGRLSVADVLIRLRCDTCG